MEVFKDSNVVRIYRQRKCNTSTFEPSVLYLLFLLFSYIPGILVGNGRLPMQM